MNNQIEGIPDGWELLGVRCAEPLEKFIDDDGSITTWAGKKKSSRVFPIIRKKPKQYRAFANAAEFEPHRDRWVRRSGKHDTPETMPAGCFRVTAYNDHHYWIGDGDRVSYIQSFEDGKCFDDGTPFGVEVK